MEYNASRQTQTQTKDIPLHPKTIQNAGQPLEPPFNKLDPLPNCLHSSQTLRLQQQVTPQVLPTQQLRLLPETTELLQLLENEVCRLELPSVPALPVRQGSGIKLPPHQKVTIRQS